jgi:hypothetical protein
MEAVLLSALARWANFYVIMGSSAGALTVCNFRSRPHCAIRRDNQPARSGRLATVIHFCAALAISVVMNIPSLAVSHLAACLDVLAMIGLFTRLL